MRARQAIRRLPISLPACVLATLAFQPILRRREATQARTVAPRLMVFQLGSKPGTCSFSIRPKR